MSFNWAEYLSVAQRLCGMVVTGPPAGLEAQQRAGVSRAYYAGYVSARNRLRDVDGISIPAIGNPHQFVATHYVTHRDPQRVQIGIRASMTTAPCSSTTTGLQSSSAIAGRSSAIRPIRRRTFSNALSSQTGPPLKPLSSG